MKFLKSEKAITLISLVVTIIILLILAGISISALTQTGLFGKAKQAEQKSKDAQELEKLTLADYENKIDESLNGSRDTNTIDKEFYTLLKNKTVYTDNETIIGKWTDGKDLYRKIYHRDLLTGVNTYLESNVPEIYPVKIEVTYQQSDNSFISSTGDVTLWYNTNTKQIGFWTNLNNIRNITGFLYYTK